MDDDNIDELLCPICFKIYKDYIYQCRKGHTICNECSKAFSACPQCKEPYEEEKIRNMFLEKIISSRTVVCPNKEFGCVDKLWKKEAQMHSEECSFRDVTVKLCHHMGLDCDFVTRSRSPTQVLEHFRTRHEVKCFDSNAAFILLDNFVDTTFSKCSVWTPVLFQEIRTDTQSSSKSRALVFGKINGMNKTASVIGIHLSASKSDAAQFLMDVTFKSSSEKISPLKWTVPLVSLADAQFILKSPPIQVPAASLAEFYATEKTVNFDVCIKDQNASKSETTSFEKESVLVFNIPAAGDAGAMTEACSKMKLENAVEFVSEGFTCDGCKTKPIKGVRYNCLQCVDYDLCSNCMEQDKHPHHLLIGVRNEKEAIALKKHKLDPKTNKTKALLKDNVKVGEEQAPGSGDEEEEEDPNCGNALWQAAVDEHNKYRRRHGVPDVTGDPKIHAVAQNYANYLASTGGFSHSKGSGYGENLAANSEPSDEAAAARNAVKMWYDEINQYNFNYPGFSSGTGHFTQVVWKKSTKIGIGVAWSARKNWWVTVCNYGPAGNMMGAFPENVPRPQ